MRLFAFLRAINVGGHTVKMDALTRHFESFGFNDVETFIASGNVIFSTRSKNCRAVERKIESGLEKALGYEVKTFVRTDDELAGVLAHQAFSASAIASARSFNVGFLAEPLSAQGKKALMAFRSDIDDFHVHGRELYWLCNGMQMESTFSNVNFEKRVGARATFRGIKTIARLSAKYLE